MAINKNHEFEELEGIKCAIVEKNVPAARVNFLKQLLEFNKYQVVVAPSPAPKAAPVAPAPIDASQESTETASDANPIPPAPTSFTLGVSDVMFNATNAIFGRALHTPDGHIVSLAYWQQKESISNDEVPYFEKVNS